MGTPGCFKMDSGHGPAAGSECFHHEVSQRLNHCKNKFGTGSYHTQTTGIASLSHLVLSLQETNNIEWERVEFAFVVS